MNCLEFRRHVLTDPQSLPAEAWVHRDNCEQCVRFHEETGTLDEDIHHALSVTPPDGLAERIVNRKSRGRSRTGVWLALAASLAVLGIAVFQLARQPGASLREAVVAHIEHDQAIVQRATGAVEHLTVHRVLKAIEADSNDSFQQVTFAANCLIDGQPVAHLVIRDANREYTLILIPWRHLQKAVRIDNDGWHGIITPHQAGSLAVVTTADADPAGLERIAERFGDSITQRDA